MMKMLKGKLFVAAMAAAGLLMASPVLAQATATVHGHVQNAAGQSITTGNVEFTKDKTLPEKDQKILYTAPLDANGNYTAKDVAPGDYLSFVLVEGKRPDYMEFTVKAGDDKTVDFDMTRAEWIAKMTPEEKKELEEFKKKNAEVMSANQTINKLNATLKTVRADLAAAAPTAADVSADVASMKQATDAKPDEGLLWLDLGDTLQAQGDHLARADKAAGKPAQSDDDVLKMYSDAADAYKKGIDLYAVAKKPAPNDQAVAYNQLGNTLAKEGKISDATAAFESAAKLTPANAGLYYNNEAAVMFNAQQNDAALAAAEKAIAADPNRPDPYFIKGQVLIAKSTFDAKTQKLTAPPGCVEAYQKYLSLAPDGKNADSVREVLASLGEKIDTRYSAKKK